MSVMMGIKLGEMGVQEAVHWKGDGSAVEEMRLSQTNVNTQ